MGYPVRCPIRYPIQRIVGYPIKMITYNFEMIKNDCHFEMRKSPYLVLKWYMTVILKWGVAVLCSFRDDIWLSFRNDGTKFWSRELFWSTNELSYEHKRAMVKRSQMEECSPIRAVFFVFSSRKFEIFRSKTSNIVPWFSSANAQSKFSWNVHSNSVSYICDQAPGRKK